MEVPRPTALWLCRRYVLHRRVAVLFEVAAKTLDKGVVVLIEPLGVSHVLPVSQRYPQGRFRVCQVGVDNVCERAAVKACGEGGKLICPKVAENGMTIAIAMRV